MARIVVLQHNPHAHAGRLGRTLMDHGFWLDVRRPDLDPDQVPADIDDLHGLVILGGRQNVDENHAFLGREQALIRAMHAAERPVVGVCLGAQQITVALGGKVDRMPEPEVGLTPIHLTVPGRPERAIDEHNAIFLAWKKGQAARVERLVTRHIQETREDLVTLLAFED